MQFTVNKLTSSADFSACASLMVQSNPWDKLYFSKDQCEAVLSHPEISVQGAIRGDGTILGFLASMANGIGFEPLIEYVCVDSRFRSNKIGTKLIEHFEEVLFPTVDNLYLFVSDINPDAARLYVRLGYLMVGAFENFNLEMQTEFLYRKTRRPRQAVRMAKQRQAGITQHEFREIDGGGRVFG
jgi:ribosomal protein S18 acetylase RimI-like enzyme